MDNKKTRLKKSHYGSLTNQISLNAFFNFILVLSVLHYFKSMFLSQGDFPVLRLISISSYLVLNQILIFLYFMVSQERNKQAATAYSRK